MDKSKTDSSTAPTTTASSNSTNEPPQSFVCPITQSIMKDPVIDDEGNSYEKTAIEEWLQDHTTSPITRNALVATSLRPNRALKDMIEDWRKNQGLPVETSNSNSDSNSSSVIPTLTTPTSDVEVEIVSNSKHALISLLPPEISSKVPCNVACVVDVSGSMGVDATLKNDKNQDERTGFSVLDIVKHAVLTIIDNLSEFDSLSLISYTNTAKVDLEMTKMDKIGKMAAKTALKNLTPLSATNLWDGLHKGLESIRTSVDPNSNSVCLLLTDGLPNVIPPRGHIPMLQKYKDSHGLGCTIHTFGFGYNLDSKLLMDIALQGNGSYAFIPDSSLVGTVFINSISNILVNKGKNAILSIEPSSGVKLVNPELIGFPHKITSWGIEVDIGSIGHGQPHDILVELEWPETGSDIDEYLSVVLQYQDTLAKKPVKITSTGTSIEPTSDSILRNFYRLSMVNNIREGMFMRKKGGKSAQKASQDLISSLASDVKASSVKDDPFIVELLKELQDQVASAFSRDDWYRRWGVHYLPSLLMAHLSQSCNNFKDPAVQHYAGKIFSKIRDSAEDVFMNLPPPPPSNVARGGHAFVGMTAFNNSSAPCFSGRSLVTMFDGSQKPVSLIRKGDVVASGSSGNLSATVKCVLKTKINSSSGRTKLVKLGGLEITPWHPIRINGRWVFPNSVAKTEFVPCPFVYSFVLESNHSILIGGVECVTLGHGFVEPGVTHLYFGTQRVLKDLSSMNGWNSGLIQLSGNNSIVRNGGRVVGLRQN